jgi:hypothetical protein
MSEEELDPFRAFVHVHGAQPISEQVYARAVAIYQGALLVQSALRAGVRLPEILAYREKALPGGEPVRLNRDESGNILIEVALDAEGVEKALREHFSKYCSNALPDEMRNEATFNMDMHDSFGFFNRGVKTSVKTVRSGRGAYDIRKPSGQHSGRRANSGEDVDFYRVLREEQPIVWAKLLDELYSPPLLDDLQPRDWARSLRILCGKSTNHNDQIKNMNRFENGTRDNLVVYPLINQNMLELPTFMDADGATHVLPRYSYWLQKKCCSKDVPVMWSRDRGVIFTGLEATLQKFIAGEITLKDVSTLQEILPIIMQGRDVETTLREVANGDKNITTRMYNCFRRPNDTGAILHDYIDGLAKELDLSEEETHVLKRMPLGANRQIHLPAEEAFAAAKVRAKTAPELLYLQQKYQGFDEGEANRVLGLKPKGISSQKRQTFFLKRKLEDIFKHNAFHLPVDEKGCVRADVAEYVTAINQRPIVENLPSKEVAYQQSLENAKTLGGFLEDYRKSMGTKMTDVAQKMGKHPSSIEQLEKQRFMRTTMFEQIMDGNTYDLPVDDTGAVSEKIQEELWALNVKGIEQSNTRSKKTLGLRGRQR